MMLMRRLFAIAFVAALGGTAAMAGELPAGQRQIFERLQAAEQKLQQGDCRSSSDIFEKAFSQAEFQPLPVPLRVAAYQLALTCAITMKNYSAAYREALAGTQLAGATSELWASRFELEVQDKHHTQAVETVEAMARQNAEAVNALPIRWLAVLNRDLREETDKTLQLRLLKVLAAPTYQPDEPLNGDAFKRDYAVRLVEAGDKDAAATLVARIADPSVLIYVSVDSRLRSMLPPTFDGRAPVELRLARAREFAASHAGSLEAVLEVARRLRQLGRAEDAVATLEAARPEGAQAEAFADLAEMRNWWWDSMARCYQMLGRYDEAVAALLAGIDIKEDDRPNVSQTINLADAQLRFGHPAEALATVAKFESSQYPASPYGEMEFHLVRGCAWIASGQATAARDDLAYAAAHERDDPEALMDLLLCAGDMSGAAAAVIRRLDNPNSRADALLKLSDYDPPSSADPPAPFEALLPALKARPDVQAAIGRAGGTRRFRLQAQEI